MAVLIALTNIMQLDLPPIELARIGQWAESRVVGAQTGLLDQLTSLCGKRDHLLYTDFQSLNYRTITLPPGWAFVAIDSGVKHDLTQDYNDRRMSCQAAASAMGIDTLRDASVKLLSKYRSNMTDDAYRCGTHIVGENQRVREAVDMLTAEKMQQLGNLMFESHRSSQNHFRNSCPQLDWLIDYARQDSRCYGARLSGGGFGGISIHLVRHEEAEKYRSDLLNILNQSESIERWSGCSRADDGAIALL